MKRWGSLIAAVLLIVLVLAAFKGFAVFKMIQGFKAQGQPKFTVATMKADPRNWQTPVQRRRQPACRTWSRSFGRSARHRGQHRVQTPARRARRHCACTSA